MQQENAVIVAACSRIVGRPPAKVILARIVHSRLCRAAVAIVLPFVGVVAAFGIAPDTVTEPVKQKPVVLELALPTASAGKAAEPARLKPLAS